MAVKNSANVASEPVSEREFQYGVGGRLYCVECVRRGGRQRCYALDPARGALTCARHTHVAVEAAGPGALGFLPQRAGKGLYAQALKDAPALQSLVKEYQSDPELLKLDNDIALSRALLHSHMEKLAGSIVGTEALRAHFLLLEMLGRQIKLRTQIAHSEQYLATHLQVQAWMAQIAELFTQVLTDYVTDPARLREAKAAVARGVAQLGVKP